MVRISAPPWTINYGLQGQKEPAAFSSKNFWRKNVKGKGLLILKQDQFHQGITFHDGSSILLVDPFHEDQGQSLFLEQISVQRRHGEFHPVSSCGKTLLGIVHDTHAPRPLL